jgi:acetyl-CoA carboxylase carboxyltransferase component
MDKLSLLHMRKQKILDAGKTIRGDISSLVDEDSFVELSAFSFSKNEFYGEDAEGEGVVTGFATIGDYPFCVVAQNSEVLSGGVSEANCEKIAKCLDQAEKTSTPVIYLLSTSGVQIGEGVNVLEGLAWLILECSRLRDKIPQYLVVNGDVYGQIAILAGLCDFTFFIEKKSVLALNSPLVISAGSGKNLPKLDVGGAKGLCGANLATFEVASLQEVKDTVIKLSDIISVEVDDYENLNELLPNLDKKADEKGIISIFDKGSQVELGKSYSPEVKCILGRIGGIAVACAVFCGGDEGVKLNAQNVRKLRDFAKLACYFNLPYVTFVNTVGAETTLSANNSLLIREIGEYVSILDCMSTAKISVVYGKAIGLGYTIFAAKSMGYDYTYAFATSKIALFDSVQGAEIEFGSKGNDEKLAKKYADENSDPINAAKGGYIDNIIQPSNVKQYLIASLQMLIK